MNVRVLLLPDGDDPDSFARKHSTEELKRYIEENQQDFIDFKTRLTVEGVSDPVKRSEAISGIVKSISVIPDAILRSTYISDLASRLGLKEQTLISSMNKFIRESKPTLDSSPREGSSETPISDIPQQSTQSPIPSGGVGGGPIETLLMREVVRHGEEVIYDNVETEDGETVNFNVAQYIAYDLGQDGLIFSNPLYNQMLAEAVAHSGDEGFKAETYFMNHPDIEVSQTAARLAVDRHQLGGRFVMQPREGSLRQRVVHLIMDLRMDLVSQRLKEIQLAMRQATGDMERVMQLMEEYKETQQLRDLLAHRLGSDVIV